MLVSPFWTNSARACGSLYPSELYGGNGVSSCYSCTWLLWLLCNYRKNCIAVSREIHTPRTPATATLCTGPLLVFPDSLNRCWILRQIFPDFQNRITIQTALLLSCSICIGRLRQADCRRAYSKMWEKPTAYSKMWEKREWLRFAILPWYDHFKHTLEDRTNYVLNYWP